VTTRDAQPDPGADAAGGEEAVAAAADRLRSSALGRLASSEGGLTAAGILDAVGGVRGIVEAVLPGLAFLVVYTFTNDLVWSVGAPLALGACFVVARLVQRQNFVPAIAGVAGMALSGFLALRTGNGEDYFVVGFVTNAAYGAALLLSVLVGWPVIGLAAGLLAGDATGWRRDRRVRRWMAGATLGWVAFFALRLVVQVPLYFAQAVEALALTKLVMGTPMYAVLLALTVVVVRGVLRASNAADRADAAKVS